MAWYPGAIKRELQPESDAQPAIRPTQLILHSIAAPWEGDRTYEYWRDSTNLESHFGLDFDGDVWQYIGTETRADANASANRRGDGTGAVSVESASNLKHTDPWTDAQIDALIRLGVWLHRQHGIPLRICRTWDDPGFGYHRMFRQWSVSGTACPGDARVAQFKDRVMPGIIRAAQGGPITNPPQEEDMALTEAEMDKIAQKVWQVPIRDEASGRELQARTYVEWDDQQTASIMGRLDGLSTKVDDLAARVTTTPVTVDAEAVAAALASNTAFLQAIARAVADEDHNRSEA